MRIRVIDGHMNIRKIPIKNKLINLENVNFTSPKSEIYISPKMERMCAKKEYDPETNELYESVMQTQKYVSSLVLDDKTTIDILYDTIIKNLENDENKRMNIDEIYCVLASYSLWELIEKIFEKYPITKISKNGHKFNTLHKTLLPLWLWNFHHTLHVMSNKLQRTQKDVVKTVEFLIKNDLVESMIEPTPREVNYHKIKHETAIVLITQTIPNEIFSAVYREIYELLLTNLTGKRKDTEISYMMNRYVELKKKNEDNYEYMLTHFGNYIKWICMLDYKKVVQIFIEKYMPCKKNVFVENYKFFINLLIDNVTNDKIWNMYFEKYKWTDEYIENIMTEIINSLILIDYDKKTVNILIEINENYCDR